MPPPPEAVCLIALGLAGFVGLWWIHRTGVLMSELDYLKYHARANFTPRIEPGTYVMANTVALDDDYTLEVTLSHLDGNKFEIAGKADPEAKVEVDFLEEWVEPHVRAIALNYHFEIRKQGGVISLVGINPDHKRLIDEAMATQSAIGQTYIQAKYHDGPGDALKLERVWNKALKRHNRRYYKGLR